MVVPQKSRNFLWPSRKNPVIFRGRPENIVASATVKKIWMSSVVERVVVVEGREEIQGLWAKQKMRDVVGEREGREG